jgi:hypothetical protein
MPIAYCTTFQNKDATMYSIKVLDDSTGLFHTHENIQYCLRWVDGLVCPKPWTGLEILQQCVGFIK